MNLVRVSGRALLPAFLLVQVWSAAAAPPPAAAQPSAQFLPAGATVGLAGTPHLWIAGDDGLLHWAGDTRALAGHPVDWGNRHDLSLDELNSLRRGDPWLSAGLLKIGDPIYLVKWEGGQASPTLLHIQSIGDVALFGINATNYGAMVLEQAAWEAAFGFAVSSLTKAELEPAVKPLVLTGPTSSTTLEGTAWLRVGSRSMGSFSWGPTLDALRLQYSRGPISDYSWGVTDGSLSFKGNFRFDAVVRILSGKTGLTLLFQQGTLSVNLHYFLTPGSPDVAISAAQGLRTIAPPTAPLPAPVAANQDITLSVIRVANQLAFSVDGTEVSRLTIDQAFTGTVFIGAGAIPGGTIGTVDWKKATMVVPAR